MRSTVPCKSVSVKQNERHGYFALILCRQCTVLFYLYVTLFAALRFYIFLKGLLLHYSRCNSIHGRSTYMSCDQIYINILKMRTTTAATDNQHEPPLPQLTSSVHTQTVIIVDKRTPPRTPRLTLMPMRLSDTISPHVFGKNNKKPALTATVLFSNKFLFLISPFIFFLGPFSLLFLRVKSLLTRT